jgi:hypothetical protein
MHSFDLVVKEGRLREKLLLAVPKTDSRRVARNIPMPPEARDETHKLARKRFTTTRKA